MACSNDKDIESLPARMFNSDHSEERANYEKCCSLASSHNLIMGRDGCGGGAPGVGGSF